MAARVGGALDPTTASAFNERHNSEAQRAWLSHHVSNWAATQPAAVQPLATELVSGCRWLVRSDNADLVLPQESSHSTQELAAESHDAAELVALELASDSGTGAILLIESLDLSGSVLTSLPAGLRVVLGDLVLRDCTALAELLQALVVGGQLDVLGCSGFIRSSCLVAHRGERPKQRKAPDWPCLRC